MKRQIITLLAVALAAGFASCSDVLDIAPDGFITEKDVFSDKNNTGAYLNTCYSYISAKGYGYYWTTPLPAVLSDEAWDADDMEAGLPAALYYNGGVSSGSNPWETPPSNNGNETRCSHFWQNYWTAIRLCSTFIRNITPEMEAADKDYIRWKAEARVLRASYYSELLRIYGTVPFSDQPYDMNMDYSTLRKASYHEVAQFIFKDCDDALAVDDQIFPWRITSDGEKLRVTKAIAHAVKSRVALFMASPLNCRDSDGTARDYWEEAYNVNKVALKALRDNGYELYRTCNNPDKYDIFGSVSDNWGDMSGHAQVQFAAGAAGAAALKEYFSTAADYSVDPRDRETIWQHVYIGRGTAANEIWGIGGVGIQHAYKTGACPSQELVDAFEAVSSDGSTASPVLALDDPYKDRHLDVNYFPGVTASLYNPQKPYENRDPRMYITLYYDGCKRYTYWEDGSGAGVKTIYTDVDNTSFGFSVTSRIRTRTGYYGYKFMTPTEGSQNYYEYPRPTKLIRLAEIILNFAECAAEYAVRKSDAAVMQEAIGAVDEIRARAGMPSLANSKPVPSLDNIVSLVRKERRVELAFEEDRYYSLRRWQEPDGDLRATDEWVTGMKIKREGGSPVYTRSLIWQTPRNCWENKFLRQPIPRDEATNLEVQTGQRWQNQGW